MVSNEGQTELRNAIVICGYLRRIMTLVLEGKLGLIRSEEPQ